VQITVTKLILEGSERDATVLTLAPVVRVGTKTATGAAARERQLRTL